MSPQPSSSDIKRRLGRARGAEQQLGRMLLEHDGPDERFTPGGGVATSTGRVGHITELRFDVLTFTYAGESKLVRMPAPLLKWWLLLTDKADLHHKEPVIRWVPSNPTPSGRRVKVPPMHVITEERHLELLDFEWKYRDLQD